MKQRLLIVAVLMLAALAVTFFLLRRGGAGIDGVRVSGNIEVTAVEVSFKIPGRVKERLVDEGETVTAGQLVARLDEEDLLLEVAQRRRDVEVMGANLRELESGFRSEEIAQADAVVKRARAEAERLEADFARQESLFRSEIVSRHDFDAARAARDSSQASLREATAQQELIHRGQRRERIDAGRAQYLKASEALTQAETRLGYATLVAPVAGVVLAKNVESGEQVAAGTPVITVGDLARPWMRAYIAETDLGRVKLGQKARITSDTWPDKAYEGTVTFISPEAEFTPKNVQTEKERVKLVYRIKISLANPDNELKPGMPADAEIGTGDQGSGTRK
jgi:HlyD family secretion protein